MAGSVINDVGYMRDAVFFEGDDIRRRLSRFWILLVMASLIAAAGVVGDSTATVIGAMIVAPLMTPIQGTMLAVIVADRMNLARSLGLVLTGAAAAIGIGYVVAMSLAGPIVASNNAQVAARVNPKLIDLIAALATGVVGAVALVRSDISDTLPGVAIAISLVPPLVVVGLTAEAGEWGQAGGALLLFATNVAAILLTGIIVMAIYRVPTRLKPPDALDAPTMRRRPAVVLIVAFVLVVAMPLTATSISIAQDTRQQDKVQAVAESWADGTGWDVLDVTRDDTSTIVRIAGLPPLPDTAEFATLLTAAGIDPTSVVVEYVPRSTLPAGG